MKVSEFLDVLSSDEREVFIKANGRRTYFEGKAKDVPRCLKDAEVEEINAQIYPNGSEENNKFYSAYGIWVRAIPELDRIIDRDPDALKENYYLPYSYNELYEKEKNDKYKTDEMKIDLIEEFCPNPEELVEPTPEKKSFIKRKGTGNGA